MAGPSWLAGPFAVVMILTAGYSASRLIASRRRRVATEADADGLHVIMGAAMAGMLVPPLSVVPRTAWMVAFGTGAAWFGGCALHGRSHDRWSWRCRFPVPHLIECVAMLYMLASVRGAGQGTAGMAMPGMSGSAGPVAGFPALAMVLALFMLGYVIWTADQLATQNRARFSPPDQAGAMTQPARGRTLASPAVLAPHFAAFGKLAMGITMGYMLLGML